MLYKSTRNDKLKVTASQAISQGISEEGGLFVPDVIPSIKDDLSRLAEMDYYGRAKEILKLYLSDFTEEEIAYCVDNAYAPEKFENSEPIKMVKICDGEKNIYSLELWHGPTCAFKDMALQILPYLLTTSLKKNYDGKTAVILVATSGDTGKAALEGFKDVENTKIMVFYPDNGVSAMQLRQMVTQEGDNVCVCAVKGNFDDCQTQVKKIFTNKEIKQKLADNSMMFSSANSINWGRLLPQVIYYVSSYLDLYKNGEIDSLSSPVNVVVPTGNFGNILAAYYAKRMGINISRFICASNSNNVLTDFIKTGKYDVNRSFYTTISPSMDILVSSNLERLLYHLSGENSDLVNDLMRSLASDGVYTVPENLKNEIQSLFAASCCDDEQTKQTIDTYYSKFNYLMDTHTAVAFKAYNDYFEVTKDETPVIIASTASAYKFSPSVLDALGHDVPDDDYACVEALSEGTGTEAPLPLMNLKNKEVRFDNSCDKDTIKDFVLTKLGLN